MSNRDNPSNLETVKALEHLAACMRGALNGKASGHVDMHICALDAQVVQRAANLLKPPDETTTEFDVVGAAKFAEEIIQRVCELPDRNSPDDEPEALVCSPSELEGCIVGVMEIRWERKTGRSVLDQSPPKTSCSRDKP